MEIKNIHSYQELHQALSTSKKSYLLLYKSGSEQSDCALSNFKKVELESGDLSAMASDVSAVRDIHEKYGISSVPALLEFDGIEFINVLKGCLGADHYKTYFEKTIYELKSGSEEKPSKRVTVYTTPTCPWCTTVKNFLRKHGIRYTEVNVASDQNAAKSMVAKSGQQGVPQTEINGEMVIGFDQSKLNRLLELKSN
jgi:glutaredoxin-like YruB-family protein